MNKGKLIVIEGATDGIGKSTQYQLLCDFFNNNGYEIRKHHFPSYNTYQAKPIERYLNGDYGKVSELSPYFVNSLYAIDRAITWNTMLKDGFDNGNIVLLDRYTTSSLIYQSSLIKDIDDRKRFIDYVCDFEYNKLCLQKPDMVIFLSAPFDLITQLRLNRSQNEGISNDIHESNLDFMRKVYDNSLFIANYLGWEIVECSFDNKMKSIEEIHNEIKNRVKEKLLK